MNQSCTATIDRLLRRTLVLSYRLSSPSIFTTVITTMQLIISTCRSYGALRKIMIDIFLLTFRSSGATKHGNYNLLL